MSYVDPPIVGSPEPGPRAVAELLTALRHVTDAYEFGQLWSQALAVASSPEEREEVLLAAAARLPEARGPVGGSRGPERLWLRQLADEASNRGGADLPERLVRVSREIVRVAIHDAGPDLDAWRAAVASNVNPTDFIRQAPRSVSALRDLGRVLERLRGLGVLDLVDPGVVDELVAFHRLVSRGTSRPSASVSDWMRVTRDDLLTWADRPEAPHQLPLLMRRLIRETGSGILSAHFPGGSAVTTGGWDGTVEASGDSPYVPAGRSGWELSVEKAAQAKARADFETRTKSVPLVERQEITFVEVICRQWTKARTFQSERQAAGQFRDVRAYNVDILEEWLEQAPATTVWLREILDLPVDGVSSIADVWQRWLNSTQPALDSSVVLAGREKSAAAVRAHAKAGPGITTVGGDVRLEEIVAFLGAVWSSSADNAGLDELLVLSDAVAARRLVATRSPLLLLATSAELLTNLSPSSPHRVFVAAPGGTRADVTLPPVEQRAVEEYLRERGTDFYLANELGGLARRSLLALRRRLGVHPELLRPEWAREPLPPILRRVLLAGSWNRGIEADRRAIERLTGEVYSSVEDALRSYTNVGDPFIALVDERWHVVSTMDAWLLAGEQVTNDDLDAFRNAALEVLTDVDPLLSLPPEQRVRASLGGVQPSYSHYLRNGIARTLAILGSIDIPTKLASGGSPAMLARATVGAALRDASQDESFSTWRAVSRELPLLAEAAPAEVVDAIERGLEESPELMRQMFQDREEGVYGGASSPHTEFLWALERLAWSPAYFDDAIDLLAKLHDLDPGGRLSNRPGEAVKAIIRPWRPQTSADVDQRLRAVRQLRSRNASLAWPVMLSMLPNQRGVQFLHQGPEYRDWKTGEPVVTSNDYWRTVDEVAAALVEDAGEDADRWVELIEQINSLPRDRLRALRAALEQVGQSPLSNDDRKRIWESLRKFLSHHRKYANTKWAMPEEALSPFDSISRLLEPKNPADRYAWLFRGWVDLGELSSGADFAAYEAELQGRRRQAVEEIYSFGALEGVLGFAERTDAPAQVGRALAELAVDNEVEVELLDALSDDPSPRESAAFGFFAERFRSRGWSYLDALIQRSPTVTATARLLRGTGKPIEAAERADRLGPETSDIFWREFSYVGLGHDFAGATQLASRLSAVGRYAAAIDLLALYARENVTAEYAVAAADALEALMANYSVDPQADQLREYELDELIRLIAQHRDVVGKERAVALEWFYLPLLGFEPDAPSLYQSLADDPAFFVQLISMIYRSDEQSEAVPADQTEQQRQAASNAFALLHSWRRCPGLDEDGVMHGDRLRAWVSQARTMLQEAGLLTVGEAEIGQALVACPPDDEGWPSREVRDLLEELRSERIEAGFARRIFNNRGATMRSPDAGGQQEWELVRKYRAQAADMRPRWRRLARVFDGLADTYEVEARREDAAAERRRRGLD